jgi:hypothetical protein
MTLFVSTFSQYWCYVSLCFKALQFRFCTQVPNLGFLLLGLLQKLVCVGNSAFSRCYEKVIHLYYIAALERVSVAEFATSLTGVKVPGA